MNVLDCLELVHSSPGRLRYRIHSSGRIDWPLLRSSLAATLDGQSVYWRLNAAAGSLLIRYQPPRADILDDDNAIAAILRGVQQSLLATLVELGIEPPDNETVVQIHTHPRHGTPEAHWRCLLIGLSSAFALLLLVMAELLRLACGLVETISSLRRPFVTAPMS
jgi:hypothetical protein